MACGTLSESDGFSNAAARVESGPRAFLFSTYPSGRTKATPSEESSAFGGGQGANSHEEPVRPTAEPSGQSFASSEHAIPFPEGRSRAFRYKKPATAMRIRSPAPISIRFIR